MKWEKAGARVSAFRTMGTIEAKQGKGEGGRNGRKKGGEKGKTRGGEEVAFLRSPSFKLRGDDYFIVRETPSESEGTSLLDRNRESFSEWWI